MKKKLTKKKLLNKKLVSVLMCSVLLFGTLSGCGGGKTGNNEAKSGGGNTANDGTEVTSVSDSDAVSIVEVTIPRLAKEQEMTMTVAGIALKAQLDAMVWTEKLQRAAEEEVSEEELIKILDNTVEAWRIAEALAGKTESMADLLIEAEELPEYQGTIAMLIKEDKDGNLYAAEKESIADDIKKRMMNKKQQLG